MGRQTPNIKVRVPSTAALLDFSHSHRAGHIGREVEPVTGSLRNPQHVAASQRRTGPPYCAVPERRRAGRTEVSAARKDFNRVGLLPGHRTCPQGPGLWDPYLRMFTGDTDARNPQETDKSSYPELRTYRRRH